MKNTVPKKAIPALISTVNIIDDVIKSLLEIINKYLYL